MKRGRFVYKNEACMKKMHDFYEKTLALLDVQYKEDYFETSFGKTHCLTVGDPMKPKLCTIHGGNGITTLNLKLFLPLLSDYCIIAPDVSECRERVNRAVISAARGMSTVNGSRKC